MLEGAKDRTAGVESLNVAEVAGGYRLEKLEQGDLLRLFMDGEIPAYDRETDDNGIPFYESPFYVAEIYSGVEIKYKYTQLDEDEDYDVIEMFNNNSNVKIIGYIETGLVFLFVDIFIMIVILSYVEKLFNNIKNNNTPFTLDNVTFIKKISYLMIALIIITPISGVIFNSLLGLSDGNSPFELMSILEILIIFSMSYIFEYGYEMQKDSKARMYNDEDNK